MRAIDGDALLVELMDRNLDHLQRDDWKEVIQIVADAPTITPEQKRGKWIEIQEFDDCRYVKCDQCQTVQVFYYGKLNTNFCPNCGADMREVKT